MPFVLTSPAFADGQAIPPAFTCRGADISPPLAWRDPPPGTRSFVLVIEDPDAPNGVFRHWGVYDIPAAVAGLKQAVAARQLPTAVNDFGRNGYGGPCPPPGRPHHYHFRLVALSQATLPLAPDADILALLRAAEPYRLGEAELVGTVAR